MTPAQCRELARLVYRDPAQVYAALIALADAPVDGYTCAKCSEIVVGDLSGLVEHGQRHGLGLDGRRLLRAVR